MRKLTYYTSKPKAKEIILVGKKANIYIRKDIRAINGTDENGDEITYYSAIEYSAVVPANKKLSVTTELTNAIIAQETECEAKKVRAKRDELLAESDFQMLADRIDSMTPETVQAWKDYRQALRDIPEQSGFPFEVEYPEKP